MDDVEAENPIAETSSCVTATICKTSEKTQVPDSESKHTSYNNTFTESCIQQIVEHLQNHLSDQTKSVQEIVNICTKMLGYEFYCDQIVGFCNQIIAETISSSQVIINLCKSFNGLGLNANSSSATSPESVSVPSVSLFDKSFMYGGMSAYRKAQENKEQFKSEKVNSSGKKPDSESTHFMVLMEDNDHVNTSFVSDNDKNTSPSLKNDEPKDLRLKKSNNRKSTVLNNQKSRRKKQSRHTRDSISDAQDTDESYYPSKGQDDEIYLSHDEEIDESFVYDNDEGGGDEVSHGGGDDDDESGDFVDDDPNDPDYVQSPSKQPPKIPQTKSNKQETGPEEKLHECCYCSKRFKTRQYMNKHKRMKHKDLLERDGFNTRKQKRSKPEDLVCKVCNKQFPTMQRLEGHEYRHTEERPVICETCGKAFKKKRDLERHQVTHMTTRPIACKFCDYTCVSNAHLRGHMAVHVTERNHQCDICGVTFVRKTSLQKHKNTHTGIKPFSCDLCGKKFSLKARMKLHRKIHTEVGKYKCEICGKRSHQPYNLVVHMRTHTGQKPFACEKCGKKFAHSVSLRTHRLSCCSSSIGMALMNQNVDNLDPTYQRDVTASSQNSVAMPWFEMPPPNY